MKKIFEDLFFENTCASVLGLERSCPWPRDGLLPKGLSLALDCFCVLGFGLGLEPCVLEFTSAANAKKRFPRSYY